MPHGDPLKDYRDHVARRRWFPTRWTPTATPIPTRATPTHRDEFMGGFRIPDTAQREQVPRGFGAEVYLPGPGRRPSPTPRPVPTEPPPLTRAVDVLFHVKAEKAAIEAELRVAPQRRGLFGRRLKKLGELEKAAEDVRRRESYQAGLSPFARAVEENVVARFARGFTFRGMAAPFLAFGRETPDALRPLSDSRAELWGNMLGSLTPLPTEETSELLTASGRRRPETFRGETLLTLVGHGLVGGFAQPGITASRALLFRANLPGATARLEKAAEKAFVTDLWAPVERRVSVLPRHGVQHGGMPVGEGIPGVREVFRRIDEHRLESLQTFYDAPRYVGPRPTPAQVPGWDWLKRPLRPASLPEHVTVEDALGLRPITPDLTRMEKVANVVRAAISKIGVETTLDDPVVSAALFERGRVLHNINSMAQIISEKHGARMTKVFELDDFGGIPMLDARAPFAVGLGASGRRRVPGPPTISDVAARLPWYAAALTDDQMQALRSLERDLAKWSKTLEQADFQIGVRHDIVPGGFYVPRSGSYPMGAERPPVIRAGRGTRRGKAGFEMPAQFDSQAEGISLGWRYDPLKVALNDYVKSAGGRVLEARISSYLKNVLDPETGKAFARPRVAATPEALKSLADASAERLRQAEDAIRVLQRAKRGEVIPTATILAIERVFPQIVDRLSVASRITLKDLIRAGEEAATPPQVLAVPNAGTLRQLEKLLRKSIERAEAAPKNNILRDEATKLARQLGFAKFRFARGKAILAGDEIAQTPFSPEDEFILQKHPVKTLRGIQMKALDELLETIRGKPTKGTTATGKPKTTFQGGLIEDVRKEAEARISGPPRDMLPIDPLSLPGLEGVVFPQAMANAANKILSTQGKLIGSQSEVLSVWRDLNNLYRGLRATLDLSAGGIQGLLALFNNPRAWAKAMVVQVWSLGDEAAEGAFIDQFDALARVRGRLSATEWARLGVQIGGRETEFLLGRGIFARVADVPGIKQFNRAFGAFGDTLRLSWADDFLKTELRRGRTLTDLHASGDLQRIARVVNNMTGYSRGRTFGSFGDLLLFAPRFLQSRLETLTQAAMSLRPGASLNQRIARRSMLLTIGNGTLLTVALNNLLGEETDFDPIVDGRWNPNFMRVRAFGRDWSLFGPWDSIARGIITTASGHPEDFLRGLGSGTVQIGWDWFSGASAIGEDIPSFREEPTEWAEWLITQFTPFALEEGGRALGDFTVGLADEDFEAASAGAAAFIGEMIGVKSGQLSLTDMRDSVAILEFGERYRDLIAGEKDEVDEDPRVKESKAFKRREAKREKAGKRPPTGRFLADRFRRLDTVKRELEEGLRTRIDAGLSGEDLRHAISDFKRDRWTSSEALLGDLPDDPPDGPIEDVLGELYWSASLPIGQGGELDYDALDDARARVLAQAKLLGVKEQYITGIGRGTYRGTRFDDKEVRAAVEELERAQAALRPYWDAAEDNAIYADGPRMQALYERWLGKPDQAMMRLRDPADPLLNETVRRLMEDIKEDVDARRLEMLEANPLLDIWLVTYYGRTPKTRNGRAARINLEFQSRAP